MTQKVIHQRRPTEPPDGGGDDGGDLPPRKRGKDPDRPGDHPPNGGDPDGGSDPEITEVKISGREADKVIVPAYPTVTHLDNWMSQCIANVLIARVQIRVKRSGCVG